MNLQEELKALKERIAELEGRVKEEQEFPQYNDLYYYIQASGRVDNVYWSEDVTDFQIRGMGNVFRTKEQAEFAVEKLKVEAELRKFSRPFKYGDWNFEIIWNNHENNTELDWSGYVVRQSVIYFESGEIAEKAIEAVGKERIKKYIFGVE